MPEQAAAANTDQSGWLIEMNDAGGRSFLSLSEGRVVGRPNGAWTPDRALGLRLARKQDADEFIRSFLHREAPNLTVVPFARGGE
ncbi:hypothetical protein IST4116A_01212 [Burkholderia cenocepacia]|uniref:hypothetical protein n=1 Tax=Burkholderia cenocepacia TaxID=95486 RepID=UPI0019C527A5|nr:hypothetical protein [Burkholderia cenocepacia]CAB5083060.1 hypothetical protein IST4116B_01204 [Burkholderia cenocepacia]CAB5083741.1 hypothetical protein IST4134_01213 [Burkholderia cenocepacia]CAB5087829.1 hypothetical protein IST4113_01211 [Burkholderia cenocepacia]CAB5095859.1 hypothetical protein IST439_01251 [Burkholderia cenocepacia]CAB5105288.1 hypothetical protein IST4129_01212 [Burkholderia cenocepacia]